MFIGERETNEVSKLSEASRGIHAQLHHRPLEATRTTLQIESDLSIDLPIAGQTLDLSYLK